MKFYTLYFQNEKYLQRADSINKAKQKFAEEHVCFESEIESAFQHKYPVKFLKFGIGIAVLGLTYLAAYYIF